MNMQSVKMRLVEQEILGLFRDCQVSLSLPDLRAYHENHGTFYLWRDDLVLRAAVAFRVRKKRVYIDQLLVQPGHRWVEGVESDLLANVIEESHGKPVVAYVEPDDCDLREWLADQGFVSMARSPKRDMAAMIREAKSHAVADRLAKYFR